MNKSLSYLQIARGIASLVIVLHHTAAAQIFYFGTTSFAGIFGAAWSAVDFFFVLSGFIIYYIHAKDLGKKAEWKNYMSKRLVRIYPIYWVVAIISLALIIAGNSHVETGGLTNILSRPLYILKSFLLIPQPEAPFVGVAWSLCYEMFFYLVFGIAIIAGKRVLWIFAIGCLALLGCQAIYPAPFKNNFALSFLSGNYHLEFLLGIATAWCFRSIQRSEPVHGLTAVKELPGHQAPGKLILHWIWILGLMLFACGWLGTLFLRTDFSKTSLYSRLFYGVGSALIILGISQWNLLSKNAMARFFLLLGDASYSLYLVHPLILSVIYKLFSHAGRHGVNSLLTYCLFLAATICCVLTSFFLHKKIEKPMLVSLNRFIKRNREADPVFIKQA